MYPIIPTAKHQRQSLDSIWKKRICHIQRNKVKNYIRFTIRKKMKVKDSSLRSLEVLKLKKNLSTSISISNEIFFSNGKEIKKSLDKT